MTGMAGERGRLVFTERVILSTSLLKSSSAEVILWWACMWDTNIFTFFIQLETSIHICFPQTSLSPIFQSCFFQIPDHPVKPLATIHELVYNQMLGPFSIHAKWTARFFAQSFIHWEDFTSPLPFRDAPEKDCCTAVHFHMMLASREEPSVKQTQVFSSFVNWSNRTFQETIGSGWEREDSRAGTQTTGIWATSSCDSCNLLVPSGTPWASLICTTFISCCRAAVHAQLYGLLSQITEHLALMTCRWLRVAWPDNISESPGRLQWLSPIFCNTWPAGLLYFTAKYWTMYLVTGMYWNNFVCILRPVSVGYLVYTISNFVYVTESCMCLSIWNFCGKCAPLLLYIY